MLLVHTTTNPTHQTSKLVFYLFIFGWAGPGALRWWQPHAFPGSPNLMHLMFLFQTTCTTKSLSIVRRLSFIESRQSELPSKPPLSDPLLPHVHKVHSQQVLILQCLNIKAPLKIAHEDSADPDLVIVVVAHDFFRYHCGGATASVFRHCGCLVGVILSPNQWKTIIETIWWACSPNRMKSSETKCNTHSV